MKLKMVSGEILVRKKWRIFKKFLKIFFIFLVIIIILVAVYILGFYSREEKNIVNIVLENPMENIVYANTNSEGKVNQEEVIKEAVLEFNEKYINYLIAAFGASKLSKSPIGYGNPVLELNLDGEIWSSEIIKGAPNTIKAGNDNKDLIIILSKEEAVRALLSQDIKQFLKDSVNNGDTKLEIVAGKVELASKGYLAMYKEITGKEG